jgi:hypothetical protein
VKWKHISLADFIVVSTVNLCYTTQVSRVLDHCGTSLQRSVSLNGFPGHGSRQGMSQRMEAFCAINLPCSGKDKRVFCIYYTFSYIETTNSLMQQRDTDLQPRHGSTKGKEGKYKMSTLTRNPEKNRNILYLPGLKPM